MDVVPPVQIIKGQKLDYETEIEKWTFSRNFVFSPTRRSWDDDFIPELSYYLQAVWHSHREKVDGGWEDDGEREREQPPMSLLKVGLVHGFSFLAA